MQKLSHLFKGLIKYLIAGVLVIVPLYPKFPLITIPGTYVAIRFEDLLMMMLAILTFLNVAPRLKTFLNDKIIRAFLIFFGVGAVSLIGGIFITQTVNPALGILHWLRRVEYIIPFLALLSLTKDAGISKNLNYYLKILIIVVFVAFIYGLGQRYLGFPIIITQNEEYSRGIALRWTPGSHINSTFAGHYDLAAYLVIILPIFLATLFLIKDKLSRFFIILSAGGGLWLLVNSLSRIAQISYLLAVGLTFLFIKKFWQLAVVLAISLAIIVMSGSLGARFQRFFEVFSRKIGQINYYVLADESVLPVRKPGSSITTPTPAPVFEDRSVSIRLNVEWPRSIRAFLKNPLLGSGYSSINLATDNDYLRLLGETGILGFLSFFLIFVPIGQLILKIFPLYKYFSGADLGFMAGAIGGIAGTFISAFFIDLFEASKLAITFWFILGYIVIMARNAVYDKKH
jgi:hypothetical protein